jgi:hypothetical protein
VHGKRHLATVAVIELTLPGSRSVIAIVVTAFSIFDDLPFVSHRSIRSVPTAFARSNISKSAAESASLYETVEPGQTTKDLAVATGGYLSAKLALFWRSPYHNSIARWWWASCAAADLRVTQKAEVLQIPQVIVV